MTDYMCVSIPAHRTDKGCDPYHTAAKLQLIDNVAFFVLFLFFMFVFCIMLLLCFFGCFKSRARQHKHSKRLAEP